MVHLAAHSNHSLLSGTATIPRLVARAVEMGMHSLGLTDTDGLYAAIPFYATAKRAGIKPIIGVTLNGTIILAKDRQGYAELCRLVTAYQLEEAFDVLDYARSDHLFVLSGDRRLLRVMRAQGMEPLAAITNFGDNTSRYEAGKMVAFARDQHLRPVALNLIFFLDPPHLKIHQVLSAIRHNATIDTLLPGQTAVPGSFFRSRREMDLLYGDWPETLDNTEWVAEQCNVEFDLGKPLFPEFDLPDGETAFSLLWKRAFDGAREQYKPLAPRVIERLHMELDIINRLGFAPYFLIVWDIVRHARANGIPIVGRGSAANSLVAHLLGITRVDPFKYDLYFERFLNMSRTDCPDIDLDICWRRRDEVIEYVYKKYGAQRVAMIATFNTFQARSAIREVAKTFGLTESEVGEIARQLPHYRAQDIRTVVKYLPECRGVRLDEEPLKSILEISEFIDGFPRHLSIHSGGLVIAPEPLTHFVPLQRAAKGILITQFDMHPIEDLGLIKMDLLGHRSLTVIKETVEMVRENRGIEVDVERLPDPDPLTADLIRNARSIGCFQIESPAMRALLKNTRAANTDMLIKTLSLVRPGPSGSGMKKHFIDRHLGREEVVHLHPSLEKVLADTYGVMLYQEDILKVAQVIAGLNLAEGDALRRAMTKKRGPHEMAKHMKMFLEKARANGVGEAQAEAIWGLMANFAEYSYCKAHASTYGEISYQCTYLKAHFPAEFMASVLSNRGGFYYPAVYIEEARRCGVEIRLPDVNKSQYNYTVEDGAIRVGFLEIRNLTHEAVRGILNARKAGGPFASLNDLWERSGIAHADAELLIHAGACDALGQTRPELLWELRRLAALAHPSDRSDQSDQSDLALRAEHCGSPFPALPDYSRKRRIDLEWSVLGLALSTHPLEYYAPAFADRALILSEDMPVYAGRDTTLIGWLIAERRVGLKGRGCMKFLTLEDPSGVFEAILFPKAYQQFGHLITSHGPYFLTGKIQEENGCFSLIVECLEKVGRESFPAYYAGPSHVAEVTPPFRWIFPMPDDARVRDITHAD